MSLLFLILLLPHTSAIVEQAYARAAPGALVREEALQDAPVVAFRNFSASYVARAAATATNWTALGAVTSVKDQGPHGR